MTSQAPAVTADVCILDSAPKMFSFSPKEKGGRFHSDTLQVVCCHIFPRVQSLPCPSSSRAIGDSWSQSPLYTLLWGAIFAFVPCLYLACPVHGHWNSRLLLLFSISQSYCCFLPSQPSLPPTSGTKQRHGR